MNDPFSPEADPDPPRPRLSRRDLLVLAPTATTVVAATTGCVTPRLACAPRVDDAHACQHRFCRYAGRARAED